MEIADEPAMVAAATLEGAAAGVYGGEGDVDVDGAGGDGGEGEPVSYVEIDLGRLHSAEGQTPCPGCGKTMRKSQLAIHMRNKKCEEFADRLPEALPSVAPITGRVKCPVCVHVSPNLKALRKHFASQHGEKKQCSKCKKEYGRSDALRKHERQCGALRAATGGRRGALGLGRAPPRQAGPPAGAPLPRRSHRAEPRNAAAAGRRSGAQPRPARGWPDCAAAHARFGLRALLSLL